MSKICPRFPNDKKKNKKKLELYRELFSHIRDISTV